MGTTRFILGKTRLALTSCLPTIILLVFLTDEISSFLNEVVVAMPIFSKNTEILLTSTFVASFLFSFLLHQHFLRKYSYSILATSHVPFQFIIVTVCIFLIIPFRPGTMKMENWSCYLFFGFLLSVVFSDISYLVDYYKRSSTHLTSIESVLSKEPKTEDEKKSSFLRLGGFLWVDFQNGIVVQRDETEEVLRRLTNEDYVLLVGHQASGKSVILRNLGYRLTLSRYAVFFANADSLNVDLAIKDIKNWDMSNVIILVDDVHRNPIACSDLLEKTRTHNVKLVLSSRPLNVNVFREGQGSRLVRLFEKKVDAEVSEKMISDMIVKYCKSLNLRFKPRVKDVTEIIQKCGTDLWLITYLLASWNPRKASIEEIVKADIYEKIYETRVDRWSTVSKNSIKAMQTVCALYQYEIPCAESYLIEAGLNNAAFKLVLEGHLIRKGRHYYLHHPSVAQIYLETLEFYKLIENPASLAIEILSSYLEKSEEERPHVFYKLSTFPKSLEKKTAVLKRMLEKMDFDQLLHQIEQENKIEKIGSFFRSISNVNLDSAKKLLTMLGEESLTKKLLKEPVVKRQKNLISDISNLDENLAKLLSERRHVIATVIPLLNEGKLVPRIFRNLFDYVDIAIVVDDGSFDDTSKRALQEGAEVIRHSLPKGLLPSIIIGLEKALHQNADIFVLDLFPWINRNHIPKLIAAILNQNADLVVGLHKGRPECIQAINKKGAEKFLKHLPIGRHKSEFSVAHVLGSTSFMFSKVLRVKEIEIEFLLAPHVTRAYSLAHTLVGRKIPYHGGYYLRPRHYFETAGT